MKRYILIIMLTFNIVQGYSSKTHNKNSDPKLSFKELNILGELVKRDERLDYLSDDISNFQVQNSTKSSIFFKYNFSDVNFNAENLPKIEVIISDPSGSIIYKKVLATGENNLYYYNSTPFVPKGTKISFRNLNTNKISEIITVDKMTTNSIAILFTICPTNKDIIFPAAIPREANDKTPYIIIMNNEKYSAVSYKLKTWQLFEF